jgi:hypothetical protein
MVSSPRKSDTLTREVGAPIAMPGMEMPLKSTREPGYLDPRSNNVIFWMLDGEHRVHCAVSRTALEAFDPTLSFAESLLRCFRANRAAIERAASAKYDRWDILGETVTVLEVDIEPV